MGQHSDDTWMGTATGPQTNSWATSGNPGVIGQGVGPLGRVYIFDIVPATASAINIVNVATAPTSGGNVTLNGALVSGGVATLDVCRNVVFVSSNAGDTAQTVTVTGTDYYGQTQTSRVTLNGTTSVAGAKGFKTITQVTTSATMTGTLSVGTGIKFGLPYRVTDAGYLLRTGWDNAVADNGGTFVAGDATSPATVSTGDVRGTFAPTGNAPDGSRRLVIAIGMTAIQAGPTATQTGAIGVTPA
jgi:hypothetical protein